MVELQIPGRAPIRLAISPAESLELEQRLAAQGRLLSDWLVRSIRGGLYETRVREEMVPWQLEAAVGSVTSLLELIGASLVNYADNDGVPQGLVDHFHYLTNSVVKELESAYQNTWRLTCGLRGCEERPQP